MELIDFSRPGDSVVVEVEIAKPAAAVWELWTDQARMSRWMGFVNYQPFLDGRILLDQTAGATAADPRMIIFGRVKELEAPRRLAFTWRGFMEDLRVWPADTVVALEVEGTDEGCRVSLSHSGFAEQEGWSEPLYSAYHHCWLRARFFENLQGQTDGS